MGDQYDANDVLKWNFSFLNSCEVVPEEENEVKDSTDCKQNLKDKKEEDSHIVNSTLLPDAFLDKPPETSTVIENQKTPHTNRHKSHRKKNKQCDVIQTTTKKERTTPGVIVNFSNYEDVWSNMVNLEEVTKKCRNSKIFADRTTYLPRMRAILLDWIMEVCEVYRLRRTTYYLAVDYIDRYLTLRPSVPKTQLQLLGVSCLFISSKLEEIYPPKLSEFSYVCDGACTELEILSCEMLLLNTLQWDVNPMTPTTWLNLYMQIYSNTDYSKSQILMECQNNGHSQNHFHFPQYSAYQFVRASHLIDLFSMDPGFLRFSYSIVAASSMYYIFGKEVAVSVSGYDWKELEACVEYMSVFNKIIKNSVDSRLETICPQESDDSSSANLRFLKRRIRTLINDEAHCMQTHVVDLDFFERATLLRLEQLGMRVEKTVVKREKISPEKIEVEPELNKSNEGETENENVTSQKNDEESTVVMYEIEKILDEQVSRCYDIFNILDEDNNDDDDDHEDNKNDNLLNDTGLNDDVKGIVNILKIDKKTKLSFDDILSSMHNDYFEQKYK